MEIDVTIDELTGASPFDVYICDINQFTCLYVETIESAPFTFNILHPFNIHPCYKVKVIDNNGCIIIREFCIQQPTTTTTTFIPTTTTTTNIPTTTTTTYMPTTTTTTYIPTTTTTTYI